MAKTIAATSSCSFCGKSREHFKMLVSGLAASICNECIDRCNKLIRDARQRQAAASTANKSTNDGKKKGKNKARKK